MQSNSKSITGSCKTWSSNKLPLKYFLLITLVCFITQISVQAQEVQYTKPSWWFGSAAGENFNFYRGSTQVLNENFTPLTAFHNGFGVALYLAPLVEYHRPDSYFGFMFQTGYGNQNGKFSQVITPCNCPADLELKIELFYY